MELAGADSELLPAAPDSLFLELA